MNRPLATVTLRPYWPADIEILAKLYRDAVLGLGRGAYDAARLAVWASFADDLEMFREQIERGMTLVAELGEGVAAFGQLHPADHIALLYTHPAHARRGLARAVYARLEEQTKRQGTVQLTTDASRISKPFFERMGFAVITTEQAERGGLTFERFRMIKQLV